MFGLLVLGCVETDVWKYYEIFNIHSEIYFEIYKIYAFLHRSKTAQIEYSLVKSRSSSVNFAKVDYYF